MKKRTICLRLIVTVCLFWCFVFGVQKSQAQEAKKNHEKWDNTTVPIIHNHKANGYYGIWYYNQKSNDEYVYKYSGGLGTYCAKHQPFAVYCPKVDKTFFCYGGRYKSKNQLLHMVSYYDHKTGMVPRPTVLVDKETTDAHDNPVISVDKDGYIWIFSSSHGTGRPSYVSRSKEPYNIDEFEWKLTTNFSYTQPWYVKDQGFIFFHTIYGFIEGCDRTSCFKTSPDGINWSEPKAIAAINRGHYQVSAVKGNKAGTAFNMHPRPKGLNWRTNLYYLETTDYGKTWHNAKGENCEIPVTDANSKSLVFDSKGLNVYMKDIVYDQNGFPVILVITSKGYESGPKNNPRTWTTARWTGEKWDIQEAMTSDNNYDMGSLYIDGDTWRIIGPTEKGPQPFNPGGEIAEWISQDKGQTWKMEKQLTSNSERNHTYVRRPVNVNDDFYGYWADGHGRQPSESTLYFCNKKGQVFMLPKEMNSEFAYPILLK